MKYSLIIPVYNREKLLPRLFDSISALLIKDLELIIVDNASSDRSLGLCRDFAQQLILDRAWKVSVLSQMHPGAAAARQLGLDAATAEWVYFFDSDDEMSPDFFVDVEHFMAQKAEPLDMICLPVCMCYPDGRLKIRDYEPSADAAVHIVSGMLATQNYLVRRDFIQNVGGWNTKLRRGDDWELGIRLLLASPRLAWMTERGYHKIFRHQNSMSGKSFVEDRGAITNVIEAAFDAISTVHNSSIRNRLYQALASKTMIVAARMRLDGSSDLYRLFRHRALSIMYLPPLMLRTKMSIICWLSSLGVPGAWRAYRYLLR